MTREERDKHRDELFHALVWINRELASSDMGGFKRGWDEAFKFMKEKLKAALEEKL